jgi:hypothetical protein
LNRLGIAKFKAVEMVEGLPTDDAYIRTYVEDLCSKHGHGDSLAPSQIIAVDEKTLMTLQLRRIRVQSAGTASDLPAAYGPLVFCFCCSDLSGARGAEKHQGMPLDIEVQYAPIFGWKKQGLS